ncbi:MAG: hypothetical protein P4L50_11335 [Anaerolineaceae bacterium]|nr:hypothetical protein [Anaerolineaceae bacterium]
MTEEGADLGGGYAAAGTFGAAGSHNGSAGETLGELRFGDLPNYLIMAE